MDSVMWAGTTTGKFTVKSTYEIRRGIVHGPEEDILTIISVFLTPGAEKWSILLKAREWSVSALTALGTAGSNQIVSSGSGHQMVHWIPPPEDATW
ncbi:hypothetical protein V6N13_083142 [Hibiscus sabdariffa]